MASGKYTLHLLRHADAGDPATWTGPDSARPLSRKGRRQAERLGDFLARKGHMPDAIVSSPKVRALDTAEIVAGHLDLEVTIDERLAGDLDLATVEAIASDVGAHAPLLVGHDPDFTELVCELIGAEGIEMKKGALATIDTRVPLEAGGGTLRWLVPPSVLGNDDSQGGKA
jgi:phosphohistidine phosphatase SixA